jgi:hypothetical protein
MALVFTIDLESFALEWRLGRVGSEKVAFAGAEVL